MLTLKDFQKDYQSFVVRYENKWDREIAVLRHIADHYSHIQDVCYKWFKDVT